MAIIRKLLIFASAKGLIVQAHGPVEHHKAIQLEFRSSRVTECPHDEAAQQRKAPSLEAHGLLGIFTIASSSFLVAITGREQVAQIFGKPIFVVTDVEFLPLSSQEAVSKALSRASATKPDHKPGSESDASDSDSDSPTPQHADDARGPPTDDEQDLPRSASATSIAQDVLTKKGNFGRFATQWFSRQGWSSGGGTGKASEDKPSDASAKGDKVAHGDAQEAAKSAAVDAQATGPSAGPKQGPTAAREEVAAMIPKILRVTKLILTSRSCFFSYEYDLTRRMESLKGRAVPPSKSSMDSLFFWNQNIAHPLLEGGHESFLMPIIMGFVGQRSFVVKKPEAGTSEAANVVPVDETASEPDEASHAIAHAKAGLASLKGDTETFLLTLISRRSIKRAGLRYLRRGIDDEGNCANSVETEQILSTPTWDSSRAIRSFTQVRASIPLYFSQSPYSFKPLPMLQQSEAANRDAMKKHFEALIKRYGKVQTAVLVDKHGTEVAIGEAYEKNLKALTESKDLKNVDWEWFDFHAECRGMRFENVQRLVDKLEDNIQNFGESVIRDGKIITQQKGIIRTNCMDCLDRTNVAESAFGQHILQKALSQEGFAIDLVHDSSTTWFNTLWADNGDAISRQYAGTAALKGDFTRSMLPPPSESS
jgi:hypothetical protein